MTGSIVRKTDKGFGFIKPDDGGKDVFFHAQNVVDGLFDELAEGEKGYLRNRARSKRSSCQGRASRISVLPKQNNVG
jgi:cold shock CspA family protein